MRVGVERLWARPTGKEPYGAPMGDFSQECGGVLYILK